MDSTQESKTEIQQWISKRVQAVRKSYHAYDALTENGIELIDKETDFQLTCPWHGQDRNPSARYYASAFDYSGKFHCFKCKIDLDSINIYAKFKGRKFMEALVELERRFRIKIPKKPDAPEFVEPIDRGHNYVSDQWHDVERMLTLMESKLIRLRDKIPMGDYIRFCRVLDVIQWDLNKANGVQNPHMSSALMRLKDAIDTSVEISNREI